MAYDFDVAKFIPNFLLPKEEPPVQPLQLLPVQTPPPEQPALQEQVDGKNLVNSAIAAAIPKAPNPYQLEIQRGLLAQKQAFNDAENAEQQAAAQAQANYLRDVANAAGIDVSGYGADVSLADAYKNLDSQRARDIMAAMQGYYSKNSEQYYNDEYFRGIERGLSPRKAQKVAEALKGNYQAERVNYLDGLLNSYGRDGLVMNDYGNSAIADLISEDPQRASFYATIYPNAKEAFTRYNALEDANIKQRNELEQLAVGNQYDLDRIKAQTAGNIELANNNFQNTLQRDELQQGYTRQNAYDQYRFSTWLARNQGKIDAELKKLDADLELGNATYLADYKLQLQDKDFQQKVAQFSAFADYLGYEGEGKKAFLTAAFGIKLPDKNTGKFDKTSIENGKKLHDMLDADEDKILKQLQDGAMSLSEQQVQELQGKLIDIRQFKQQLETTMGEQLGVRGGVQEFTGNEATDNATLAYLWNYANGDMDKFKGYVSNWLDKSGVTPNFKEGYIKNLKAPQ